MTFKSIAASHRRTDNVVWPDAQPQMILESSHFWMQHKSYGMT